MLLHKNVMKKICLFNYYSNFALPISFYLFQRFISKDSKK